MTDILPKAWMLYALTYWNKMTIRSRAIVKGVEGKDFLLQLTVHIVKEMSAKTFM
jgi:hypothetical protein